MPSKVLLLLASLLCLSVPRAHADDLPDQPTDEQMDHIHWQLSSFLKGTTLEVRDLINGQLEQQLARKAEMQKRISDDKAAIAAKSDAVASSLKTSSPAFAALQTQLTALQAEAARAKASSDSVAMIRAQDEIEKCQKDIQQMESPQLDQDADVIAKRKEIADTQTQMQKVEPSIATATKARNQLVEGLRTSLKLPGPPAVGKKGVLGPVKPTKIIDANSFLTDFQAIEITGDDTKSKAVDGMQNKKGRFYRCQLLVTGLDTSTLHVGTQLLLDRTFSITGTQKVGKIEAYVVAPVTNDKRDMALDYLFSKLDDIHDPASKNPAEVPRQ